MSAKESWLKNIKDQPIDTGNHDEVKRVADVSSELVLARGKFPITKYSYCNWLVWLVS